VNTCPLNDTSSYSRYKLCALHKHMPFAPGSSLGLKAAYRKTFVSSLKIRELVTFTPLAAALLQTCCKDCL